MAAATRYGLLGQFKPYPGAPQDLLDMLNMCLTLAGICPMFAVAGPGYDALWDEAGLSEMVAPLLFKVCGDHVVTVLHHLHRFRDMMGDKQDM